MKIPYLKIKQRGEVFYMTKFQAPILLDHLNFHYRDPYIELEKDEIILKDRKYIETIIKKGIDLSSNDEGVQRRLQIERANPSK